MTVHSGNVLINSVSALLTNVNVHSDYAQIKALRTNKLNAVSGKGELTIDTVLSGDAQLQCGSGKLTVNFADSADSYSINASTGNGTIEINGETVFDSADRTGTVNADAPHSINARCGLGKLSMNFTEAVCNEEN